eukprot:2220832-Alexandrium_andersonii.AAC.1
MDGWKCEVASSKESVKHARGYPYNHGIASLGGTSEKTWWIKPESSMDKVPRLYLVALLAGGKAEQAVPHLAPASVYEVLVHGEMPKHHKPKLGLAFLTQQQ